MDRPLGVETTGGHFEILARDQTTWLPLVLSPRVNRNGETVPGALASISEYLASAESDARVTPRVKLVRRERFDGGAGVSYNVAPGVYARNDFAHPAGAVTDISLPATNNSASRLEAIEQYGGGGDIFVAQRGTGTANTGRIMRSVAGTGALADSKTLGANITVRDLCIHGGYLYAAWNESGVGGGLSRWDGSGWTDTPSNTFGTNERRKMKKVFWVVDGIGASRLVTISGDRAISYLRPGGNPMTAADWVEGVTIDCEGTLQSIAAARQHIWLGATDNLYDLNGLGESPALTAGLLRHIGTGVATQYLSDYVYISEGSGLQRVYVGGGALVQEVPGPCAPCQFTPAENEFRGQVSCMTTDQGMLVAATYNHSTARGAIWWGIDRQAVGVETPNPLAWYGPEVHSSEDQVVISMKVASVSTGLRLFIGSNPNVISPTAHLSWVSLPLAGTPLQDLTSGGDHRFATGSGSGVWNAESYIQFLKEGGDDRVSNKLIHSYGSIARGLDQASGTKLRHKVRADVAPGATTWTESQDVPADSTELIPTSVFQGRQIEERYDFVSPSGTATPVKVGVLDACRIGVWEATPQTRARTVPCESGTSEAISPDTVTDELIRLTTYYRTTLRERNGKRWYVKVLQSFKNEESVDTSAPYGKRVTYDLEIDFLAEVS